MIVKRLVLKNFRNYSDLSWQPGSGINIISGNNAQGKTNILEALYYSANGRSFRTSRDKEIIGWNGEDSYVSTQFEGKKSSFEISSYIKNEHQSSFSINGQKERKNKIFKPGFAVVFTPADLDLIAGSPSGRRKWLDYELGSFKIDYLHNLSNYEKVVNQRNNLFKNRDRRLNISDLIGSWDEQLFFYGVNLITERIKLLRELFPYLREVVSILTDGREEITFNYLSSLPLDKGMDKKGILKLYKEIVEKQLEQEISRQQTLFGPHRDDLSFYLNGIEVKKYGSRGQQRTVVLALKIALMKMFNQEYQEYPVLLLDDVFLELDSARQKGLVEILKSDAQVFISSERKLAEYFDGRERRFNVSQGVICEEEG